MPANEKKSLSKTEKPVMKDITVVLAVQNVAFTGFYRRDLETGSWHYYETINGDIWHFRKEHMIAVFEAKIL